MTTGSDGAFDEFLDAIEADDAYYLSCPDGHGMIPPQRICPECHSQDLSREPLPTAGEIETYTVVSVPAPQFSDDSPYVTAIASFGPVNVTGQLRDVDTEAVDIGQPVSLTVEPSETTGDRVVTFEPR